MPYSSNYTRYNKLWGIIDPNSTLALKAKDLNARLMYVSKDLDRIWNSETPAEKGFYIVLVLLNWTGDFSFEIKLHDFLSHLPKYTYIEATSEVILNGITLNIWNFVHNNDVTSVKGLYRVVDKDDSFIYTTVVYSSDKDYGFYKLKDTTEHWTGWEVKIFCDK